MGSAWSYHAPAVRSLRRGMIVCARLMLFDDIPMRVSTMPVSSLCASSLNVSSCGNRTSGASPMPTWFLQTFMGPLVYRSSQSYISSVQSFDWCPALSHGPHIEVRSLPSATISVAPQAPPLSAQTQSKTFNPTCHGPFLPVSSHRRDLTSLPVLSCTSVNTSVAPQAPPLPVYNFSTTTEHMYHAWLNLDTMDQYLHVVPDSHWDDRHPHNAATSTRYRTVIVPPGCMVVLSHRLQWTVPSQPSSMDHMQLHVDFCLSTNPLPRHPSNQDRIRSLQVPKHLNGTLPSMYTHPVTLPCLRRLHNLSSYFQDPCCVTYTHRDSTHGVRRFRVVKHIMPPVPEMVPVPPYSVEELDLYSTQPC